MSLKLLIPALNIAVQTGHEPRIIWIISQDWNAVFFRYIPQKNKMLTLDIWNVTPIMSKHLGPGDMACSNIGQFDATFTVYQTKHIPLNNWICNCQSWQLLHLCHACHHLTGPFLVECQGLFIVFLINLMLVAWREQSRAFWNPNCGISMRSFGFHEEVPKLCQWQNFLWRKDTQNSMLLEFQGCWWIVWVKTVFEGVSCVCLWRGRFVIFADSAFLEQTQIQSGIIQITKRPLGQ